MIVGGDCGEDDFKEGDCGEYHCGEDQCGGRMTVGRMMILCANPQSPGHEFPVTFNETVRKMFRFYFHIIAHIYYSHFQEVSHIRG